MIESAKEITIVIITYNRYAFLRRLLNFYDWYSEKFNILILDSSSQKPEKSLLKYFKRDNVEYHKFNPNIFQRINFELFSNFVKNTGPQKRKN